MICSPGLSRFLVALVCSGLVALARADVTYLDYEPLVTATATSLEKLLGDLARGLTALPGSSSPRRAETLVLRSLQLPSFDGIDRTRPVSLFLLSTDPPTSLPVVASLVPIEPGMDWKVSGSFSQAYRASSGGALRCYTSPVSTNLPPSLYVALVEGHALLSPHLEGLRWLALQCRDKAVPVAPSFRRVPLHLSVDAPLAGAFCKVLSPFLPKGKSWRANPETETPYLRELSVFLPTFSALELAVGSDLSSWNVSARLRYSPAGAFAREMDGVPPPPSPDEGLFPRGSENRSSSSLPAFIRLLPDSNRLFLSALADRTQLAGFHLLPAVAELDQRLYPSLSGDGSFAFVSDPVGKFVGSLSVYGLRFPRQARSLLETHFGTGAGGSRAGAIKGLATRRSHGERIYTYDMLPPRNEKQTAIAQTAMVFAFLLEMNHVEIAVAGDRLVVARGRHGLIDHWLAEPSRPGAKAPGERATPLARPAPNGETSLGGGTLDLVRVARGALAFLPDFKDLSGQMPLPASGARWAMSRGDGSTTFDLTIPHSEFLSWSAIQTLNQANQGDFMTRFFMEQMTEDKAGAAR